MKTTTKLKRLPASITRSYAMQILYEEGFKTVALWSPKSIERILNKITKRTDIKILDDLISSNSDGFVNGEGI